MTEVTTGCLNEQELITEYKKVTALTDDELSIALRNEEGILDTDIVYTSNFVPQKIKEKIEKRKLDRDEYKYRLAVVIKKMKEELGFDITKDKGETTEDGLEDYDEVTKAKIKAILDNDTISEEIKKRLRTGKLSKEEIDILYEEIEKKSKEIEEGPKEIPEDGGEKYDEITKAKIKAILDDDTISEEIKKRLRTGKLSKEEIDILYEEIEKKSKEIEEGPKEIPVDGGEEYDEVTKAKIKAILDDDTISEEIKKRLRAGKLSKEEIEILYEEIEKKSKEIEEGPKEIPVDGGEEYDEVTKAKIKAILDDDTISEEIKKKLRIGKLSKEEIDILYEEIEKKSKEIEKGPKDITEDGLEKYDEVTKAKIKAILDDDTISEEIKKKLRIGKLSKEEIDILYEEIEKKSGEKEKGPKRRMLDGLTKKIEEELKKSIEENKQLIDILEIELDPSGHISPESLVTIIELIGTLPPDIVEKIINGKLTIEDYRTIKRMIQKRKIDIKKGGSNEKEIPKKKKRRQRFFKQHKKKEKPISEREKEEESLKFYDKIYKIDNNLNTQEKLDAGWEKKSVKIRGNKTDVIIKKVGRGHVLEYIKSTNTPEYLVGQQLFSWGAIKKLGLKKYLPNDTQFYNIVMKMGGYQKFIEKYNIIPGYFQHKYAECRIQNQDGMNCFLSNRKRKQISLGLNGKFDKTTTHEKPVERDYLSVLLVCNEDGSKINT